MPGAATVRVAVFVHGEAVGIRGRGVVDAGDGDRRLGAAEAAVLSDIW